MNRAALGRTLPYRTDPTDRIVATDPTDWAIGAVLFAVATAYVLALPHNLGAADESFFLYEAKRVSEGEVLYRDVFELVAPLSWYAMAALFKVFGATIETARGSMAVVHGLIAALVYVACRRLGVARGLATAAALSDVALCQPAWPYASPHWFGTLIDVGLLVLLLVGGLGNARRRVAVGALSGVLVGVQQQKGVVLAAGVAATWFAERLIDWRFRRESDRAERPLFSGALALAQIAAGILLVVAPLMAIFTVLVGTGPLYEALIRFPLENYRGTYRTAWAALTPLTLAYGRYTLPAFLAILPLALAVPAIDAVIGFARRRDEPRVRRHAALVAIAVFSVLSIAYYPDLIHVAFIAPILIVALADALETILEVMSASEWPRRAAGVLLTAAVVALLGRNFFAMRAEYPVAYRSTFGRIDLRDERDVAGLDEVRRLIDATPSREVFAYPGQSFVYLVAGARNPTRFQFFSTRYNTRAQVDEVLEVLAAKQVPYVFSTAMSRDPKDPIRLYIRDHYGRVQLPGSPRFWLLELRPSVEWP